MSNDSSNTPAVPAVGAPVEPTVWPCAWAHRYSPRGLLHTMRHNQQDAENDAAIVGGSAHVVALYDERALDEAVAAMRERCIKACATVLDAMNAMRSPTRSQALTAAGFTRRPSLKAMEMREALELIAAPQRPDGTWNRDREACRELAAEALGREPDNAPGPRPLLDSMTVRNACPRGYNGCGFDAKAQACVAAECPKTPNAQVQRPTAPAGGRAATQG